MKLIKEQNKPLSNEVSDKEAEEAYIKILKWIGEDPNREGLLETPKRVLKAYREYFKGYKEDATTLMDALQAKGVAVSINATHQCMTTRGIRKEQATTITNYYLGKFKDDLACQNRYLRFISSKI